MLLQATFNELNEIISQKTQIKGLTLSYLAPDAAKVSMLLNILGIASPTVSVDVKIISIDGSKVTAEIAAGKVGDFVLDKAKKPLIEKTPAGLIEKFDDKVAVLNLAAIPDLQALFDTVAINSLSFTEEAVCLDANLK